MEMEGEYQICAPTLSTVTALMAGAHACFPLTIESPVIVTIGSVALTLIEVDDRNWATQMWCKHLRDRKAVYSSRARSCWTPFMTGAFNTLPRAYDWIRKELKAKRVNRPSWLRDV